VVEKVRVEGLAREISPEDRARREGRRIAYGAARIATPGDPGWMERYLLARMPRLLPKELVMLDAEIERLEAEGGEDIPDDIALAAFLDMLELPVDTAPPVIDFTPKPDQAAEGPKPVAPLDRLRGLLSRIWQRIWDRSS
jgi:hypothetical protein